MMHSLNNIRYCEATTRRGTRCTRLKGVNCNFCFQHRPQNNNNNNNQSQETPTSTVPTAILSANELSNIRTHLVNQAESLQTKCTTLVTDITITQLKIQKLSSVCESLRWLAENGEEAVFELMFTYDKLLAKLRENQENLQQKLRPAYTDVTESLNNLEELIRCDWNKIFKKQTDNFYCSICLEDCVPGDTDYALQCNHAFHLNCIMLHLERKLNCPNCRVSLSTSNRRTIVNGPARRSLRIAFIQRAQ